jgi:antitoxin ParD1/3/4
MPTQNVNLSDHHANFIRQSVSDGGYRNASEVVRAGLRMLEQQKREDKLKLQTLRKLARQTLGQVEAGNYIDLESDQIDGYLDDVMARVKAKSRKK